MCMQLGLEGLAGVFLQELLLGGPEIGKCCVDGPEIGLPWCADGLGMVGVSLFMGLMCSLFQWYVLACAIFVTFLM